MEFRACRVTGNSNRWTSPSSKRRGIKGHGSYVEDHGFGHEDWNFNLNYAQDGQVFGHTAAKPAKGLVGKKFSVLLFERINGVLVGVGALRNSTYIRTSLKPRGLRLDLMAADLFELSKTERNLPNVSGKSLEEIRTYVESEFRDFNWQTAVEDVTVFERPIPLSECGVMLEGWRFSTPYTIRAAQFQAVLDSATAMTPLARSAEPEDDDGRDEGGPILRLHKSTERDPAVVRKFKRNLKSFECAVCNCDFETSYGEIGRGYIECHHTKPIGDRKAAEKTRQKDLAALCSNCHRMIHRTKPMMTVKDMRKLWKKQSP